VAFGCEPGDAFGLGQIRDHDMRDSSPLRFAKLVPVLLVVGPNLGFRDVGGRRQGFACTPEQLVPEDLARSLLRLRPLVETAAPGLAREQLDLDHLFEQLLAAFGRLIAKPLELIHPLERGCVFA
jgi:hypothetical protein